MGNPREAVPPARRPVVPPDAHLRASDGDRERVCAVLRTAFEEGRLTMGELDDRLAVVFAARTYAELAPIVADLPMSHQLSPGPTSWLAERTGETPTSRSAVSVIGKFERRARWVVPRKFNGVAIGGVGSLDLREARFIDRDTTIRAFSVLGVVEVVVPEDAEVHVTGTGVIGGFSHAAAGPGGIGAPRITVTGLAILGRVKIKRRPTDAELHRREQERRQNRRANWLRRLRM